DGDEHRVARFEKMQPLPWAGEGERWRPNKRLLQIVLGAIRMKDATKDLLETFIDNHGDRQPAQGFAPIATITVVGRPSDEPAVAISSFGGSPTYKNLDALKTSSPSIWYFQNILPPPLYALPLIEQVPVAAAFNPEKVAVLNTVLVSDVVVTKIT